MKALFDTFPTYCPSCGLKTEGLEDDDEKKDWEAHLTHVCHGCDLEFQYAETAAIDKAATEVGGDLAS